MAEVITVEISIDLADVDNDLAQAEKQLEAAATRVEELRQIRKGLEWAVVRYGLKPPDAVAVATAEPGTVVSGWETLPLKDVVLQAVREIGRAVATRDVYDHVRANGGRADKYEAVRASLNYLKKLGEVQSVRPGIWTLPAVNADSPALTGLSVVPVTTSEEGATYAETGDDNDHVPGRNHSDGRGAPLVMRG